MKIKLSKNQWEFIGKKAGWIKQSRIKSAQVISPDMQDQMGDLASHGYYPAGHGFGSGGVVHSQQGEIISPKDQWIINISKNVNEYANVPAELKNDPDIVAAYKKGLKARDEFFKRQERDVWNS